jgi:hypothetical protein
LVGAPRLRGVGRDARGAGAQCRRAGEVEPEPRRRGGRRDGLWGFPRSRRFRPPFLCASAVVFLAQQKNLDRRGADLAEMILNREPAQKGPGARRRARRGARHTGPVRRSAARARQRGRRALFSSRTGGWRGRCRRPPARRS